MLELIAALIVLNFAIVMVGMPRLIVKLNKTGTVTIDRYKQDLREVPTQGGIAIVAVVLLVFILATLFDHLPISASVPLQLSDVDWAILIVAGLFAAFGLVDDLVDVGRKAKLVLLFFLSYRLIFDISSTLVTIPFLGSFEFGVYYLLLIVPLYVMVVANLVNMHSGFNGLGSGLSAILLFFMLIKMVIAGSEGVFVLSGMLGATLGFLWYNRYPARVLEGNVGSLALGATLGAVIVVSGFLVAGFVMLIPHTVNFLMYVYWRLMHRLYPEDERWRIVKFGKVRADGTLDVPNRLTLKWVLPSSVKMTEQQAVLAMYALTIPFCVIGLLIPY
ncbi:MAG: UDP-N-acetylglucosamine-1-phosphate transferase [Methanophagales archaeon ANME-1-THS]|nr:MAG: UDP-N-acetylglucosamine-1-phosphate transferase [Methanophagales archaeon ANME-1-THS]